MPRAITWKDDSGVMEEYFQNIINTEPYFEFIRESGVKILYTFTNKEGAGEDDELIQAYCRKIPNKERDIYGYDFEICYMVDAWNGFSEENKYRLAYHELLHVGIGQAEEDDENYDEGDYYKDELGKLVTWVNSHDLVVVSFRHEVERFGLGFNNGATIENARFLATHYAKLLKDKKKSKGVSDDGEE